MAISGSQAPGFQAIHRDYEKNVASLLATPNAAAQFVALEEELGGRQIHRSVCTVLSLAPPAAKGKPPGPSLGPATVTAFLARSGEPLLKSLADAVRKADPHLVASVLTEIRKTEDQFAHKLQVARSARPRQPLAPVRFPPIGEIRYAERTLVSHLAASDDLPVNVQVFPY